MIKVAESEFVFLTGPDPGVAGIIALKLRKINT
jgi:hypothetical protein